MRQSAGELEIRLGSDDVLNMFFFPQRYEIDVIQAAMMRQYIL
ncbi:hypothetical protein [Pseudomonas putida]|nr:hypothetical protein [Pseudomonas putida]